MARQDRERRTFADTVAEVRAAPPRREPAAPGRHGDHWGDPDGYRYELVTDELAPRDALRFASQGALALHRSPLIAPTQRTTQTSARPLCQRRFRFLINALATRRRLVHACRGGFPEHPLLR